MNYTLVGAFVLALGAVLIGAVLWLASGGAFRQQFDLYQAVEDGSVAGLSVNAPVKFNGVDVGKVRSIHLDPLNPERVILLFAIEPGTPVKEDTVATLKTQGLTGIAYIELSGGTRNAPRLGVLAGNAYPVIRTKPSLAARLENVLTTVLAKLDRTTTNIDSLLSSENQEAIKSALADIALVARTISSRKSTIDQAIVQAARAFEGTARAAEQVPPVLERIGRVADQVPPMLEQIGRVAEQVPPVLERIGRGADAVDKMGQELALAGASATKAVDIVGVDVKRLSSETLPELQRLLGELGVLAASLRRVSEQIERDPRGLIFGRTPVAPGPGEVKTAP